MKRGCRDSRIRTIQESGGREEKPTLVCCGEGGWACVKLAAYFHHMLWYSSGQINFTHPEASSPVVRSSLYSRLHIPLCQMNVVKVRPGREVAEGRFRHMICTCHTYMYGTCR
jgi:hypothetical protein